MRKLRRLWKALEAPYGVVGVRAHLAQVLGEDLSFAEPLLRRLPQPSEVYPCPYPGGPGCPRRVIHRRDGSIVAVCGCDPAECDEVPLQPEDTVAYELDGKRVCSHLAGILKYVAAGVRVSAVRQLWNAGSVAVGGKQRQQVFLALVSDRQQLRSVVDHLVASFDGAFILLVPTLRFCDAMMEQALRARSARLLALEEIVQASNGNRLTAPLSLGELLASDAPAGRALMHGPAVVRFNTPAGCSWGDIEIRFLDGHTVSVRAGDRREVFNYTQMGMASKKNAGPTVLWGLLQQLAENRGTLAWRSAGADRRNPKRIERLGKALKAFFGLAEGPFHKYEKKTGWRAKFRVLPE